MTTVTGTRHATASTSSTAPVATSAASEAKASALSGAKNRVIQPGDTLTKIVKSAYPGLTGAELTATVNALAFVNGIASPDRIKAGATLKMPTAPKLQEAMSQMYLGFGGEILGWSSHKQALASVLEAKRFAFPDGSRLDFTGDKARLFTLDGRSDQTFQASFDGKALTLTDAAGATSKLQLVIGAHGYALKNAAGQVGEAAVPAPTTLAERLNASPFFGIKPGAIDIGDIRFYGDKVSMTTMEANADWSVISFPETKGTWKATGPDSFELHLGGAPLKGTIKDGDIQINGGFTYSTTPDWFSA